jgi:hypothetical protein
MAMAIGKIALPEKMDLVQQGSHIEIVRRWFDSEFVVIGMIGMVLGWIVFGHLPWNHVLNSLTNDFPSVAFHMAFALAAIWTMYYGAAGSINRTRISVSPDRISVRHGPLPWLGNRQQETANLKQFYVQAKLGAKGRVSRYEVFALTRSNEAINLVNGPRLSSMQASYIQQELERLVRIRNADSGTAETARAGLVIFAGGAGLEIVKRWFDHNRTVGMSVFSMVWMGGMGYMSWAWYTARGTRPLWPINPNLAVMPLAIDALLLAVGILLAYRAAAEWLNRTRITVNHEMLSVRHGPVPWWGNFEAAVSGLKELQVRKSRWGLGSGGGRPIYKHEVHAAMADGRSRKLVGGFDSQGQAERVKEEIEKYLGLGPDLTEPKTRPRDANDVIRKYTATKGNSRLGLVFVYLFGFGALAAGIFFIASVVELNNRGFAAAHQLIRFLLGLLLLAFGSMLLGAATRRLSDRVVMALYIAIPVLLVTLMLLSAIFGTGFVHVRTR